MSYEIQLDYFLANLLFGMILITTFVSFAHSWGDILHVWFRNSPGLTQALRVLILVICGLSSLYLFLLKLNWPDKFNFFDNDQAHLLHPYLVNMGKNVSESSQSVVTEGFDKMKTWTLVTTQSRENMAELENQKKLFYHTPTIQSYVDKTSPENCRSWVEHLNYLGLKTVGTRLVPSSEVNNILLFCTQDSGFLKTLPQIMRFVRSGGSVLLIGGVSKKLGQDANWKSFFGITKWSQPPGSTFTSFVFGGSLFNFGGIHYGLRLGFGDDWGQQGGDVLAERDTDIRDVGGYGVLTDPAIFKQGQNSRRSPYLLSEIGRGRALWTSLPGNLSPQVRQLFGHDWDVITGRMLLTLAGWPILGVAPYGYDVNTKVNLRKWIPILVTDIEDGQIKKYIEIFNKFNINPTTFLPMGQKTLDSGIGQIVAKNPANFAIAHFGSRLTDSIDIYKQLSQFFLSRRFFERLVGEIGPLASDNESSTKVKLGVSIQPGSSAAVYAAALGIGFNYVVGAPFNDWLGPYAIELQSTADFFGNNTKKAQNGKHRLQVLPADMNFDFHFRKSGKYVSANVIQDEVFAKMDWFGQEFHPLPLVIHTQAFVGEEGMGLLNSLLEALPHGDGHWLSIHDFLDWNQRKEELQLRLTDIANDKLVYKIRNTSEKTVENINWLLRGHSWRLKTGSPIQSLKLQNLHPGEEQIWTIVR